MEPSEQDKKKAREVLDQLPVDYVGTGTSANYAAEERCAIEVVAAALADKETEVWNVEVK